MNPFVRARIVLIVISLLGGAVGMWIAYLAAHFLGLFVGEPGVSPP